MIAIIATDRDLEKNRYITKNRIAHRNVDVRFIRPNGKRGLARKVSILKRDSINEFSLEYFALEFTRDCNVQCADCYVSANKINGQKPTYIDLQFIVELAQELKYSPAAGWREICITGGEPTLDVTKLQTRYGIFNELVPRKHIAIASNLLAIPHSEESVAEFFSKFSDALIQASYNPFLEKQYGIIAANITNEKYERFKDSISRSVSPEFALLEKIRLFDDYAHKHSKKFRIRVNGVNREEMDRYKQKALSYLGNKGRSEHDFIYASRVVRVGNGRNLEQAADPTDSAIRECEDQEEIYMCINGSLFPTVNHIDNPKARIGTLVRLLDYKKTERR